MSIVPAQIFEQHVIVLGKTRSGKSSVMRLLVEEFLLDEGKPVCIVDPKGDWWGLKASASGKQAGYPIVIFGGEHGDVPLNARSGATVGELIATGNRSCIIDLGGWMPGDRTQFWIDFASTFFRLHKGRHWLVIDEVHNLAPKGKILDPNAGKMLHWSNRLASEGLGKGISMMAASQRPQKVHNDFLTSCETLIAMRVIHKADRDALADWIDGCGDPEKGEELLNTIALMKRGEGWVWSPEAEFGPKRMQFPMFRTYDSFKPQGAHETKLEGWAEVDLGEISKKLEAVVKEAEAKDPGKLQARIRELEKALREKPGGAVEVKVADPRAVERAVKAERERFAHDIRDLQRVVNLQRKGFEQIAEAVKWAAGVELPKLREMPEIPRGEIHAKEVLTTQKQPGAAKVTHAPRVEDFQGEVQLKAGARRMLMALAQWYPEPKTRDELGVLTGIAPTGGTFGDYLSKLRIAGYVTENGHGLSITEEGMAAVGDIPDRPHSTDALVHMWKAKFKAGVGRMLEALVERHPEAITREKLGEVTGISAAGGTFVDYLSQLRRARLIEEPGRGMVKAADSLFT